MTLKFGHKEVFTFIISILLLTDLTIFLNIPVLRQILGFLFLTLLPGLLILHTLKLNKLGYTEKFILSVGLSISFLMFFGLVINNSLLNFGYETPLSAVSLLISFNAALITLAIIWYKTNKNMVFSFPNLKLSTSEKEFLIIPILFPALCIFGMYIMNTTDNNIILMLLLFLIPIYVVFVCFFNQKFPKRLYPVVIFLISVSLLLLLSLRSNHIIGSDTHAEYYFFRTTLNNLHWGVFGRSVLDACLSISLLPTIYQSILNIRPEFLFKIMYSLIYSITPLVVYILSKKYIGEFYGFLASCFFMFQTNFLFTAYNARTNVAVLFFALAMMVLFNDRIDPVKKRILFIVFMASCMVSHYSTAYIFFFIVLGAFVGIEMLSIKIPFKKDISLTIVILFFAFIFFWYSQVTETSFDSGVVFIEKTFISLNQFFVAESRGKTTQTLFGEGVMQLDLPFRIQFVFTWLMFGLIGIGVITLIIKCKEMSFPELNFKKHDFLKDKFEVTYLIITLACAGLLVGMLALPHISVGYNLDRLYVVAITILSTFFVIGGITLSKHFFFFKKKTCAKKKSSFFGKAFFSKERFGGKDASQVRAYLIILLVLLPYFFCCTGVMYNLLGVPRGIILNSEGDQYNRFYVHDQESCALKWFTNYTKRQKIYPADRMGFGKAMSQGMVPRNLIDSSSFSEHKNIKGYIYLRYYNIVNGLLYREHEEYNMSEYSDMFVGKSKIYANGGSEIWK